MQFGSKTPPVNIRFVCSPVSVGVVVRVACRLYSPTTIVWFAICQTRMVEQIPHVSSTTIV